MSLRALQESLQSAAWTPPQRRFFEQLIAYVLPRTLLPGSGIDITQDAALGTLTFSAQAEARTLVFQYDISGDETTTLTTGTAKRTWRMPIPFTLRSAYASLTTASSSGAVVVDVNADNSSVFGTNKLSIDQGEESSFTATTAVDLTEQLIDADVELTFDVDDDGTNAVGLKVYLVGVYAFDTELLMFGPLDDMTVGAAYSDTLSVIGGIKPYSITTPQSLPDGITATLNGGNNTPMTISGTPTGAGLGPGTSIPFLLKTTVQDAANDVYTFSQTVTITVAAVVATIDGGALPDATVGVAYSHDVDATGGVGSPYTFTKIAGPSWLTVDSSTGALGGTPSSGDVGTGITVTVRATDAEGNYGEATDTFDVVPVVNVDDFSTDTSSQYTLTKDGSGSASIVVSGGQLYVDHTVAYVLGDQVSVTRNGTSIADGYVEIETDYQDDGGLLGRFTDQSNFYLAAVYDDSGRAGGINLRLYKRVAGGFTQLGSGQNFTWTRGTKKTVRLTMSGTTISVSVDGTTLISVTDSSHTSAGKIGVRSNNPLTGVFDYFDVLRWS